MTHAILCSIDWLRGFIQYVHWLINSMEVNSLPDDIVYQDKTCIHAYIHINMFVVVNFEALAQASDFRIERRQVVFLCWMQDSKLGSLRHKFASRLNAHSQTDWAIQDQAKNLSSQARPYDEWAFSPLDLTADWLSHLALAIYMFVLVNFDALAQASDIRITHTQHRKTHTSFLFMDLHWHRGYFKWNFHMNMLRWF